MIKFQNISKIYKIQSGPIVALDNVSFGISEGEFVSIVGKSGAGKSTLVKLLIGEEKPTNGDIFFKGESVPSMKKEELQALRRNIGVVHQDYKLLFSKTVSENLEYVMQVIGASNEEIKRDVPQVLDIVGLLNRRDNFPDELSGGEKQRLAIARALCHRPKVILADEPTGNLDLYNSFSVINVFKKIHHFGTTIILATHSKEIVDNLEQRVITLEHGKIIQDKRKGKFIL